MVTKKLATRIVEQTKFGVFQVIGVVGVLVLVDKHLSEAGETSMQGVINRGYY
jgi:hypothetical protein